ncbi:SpoIID/LytB domain-containing protein [Nocardioides terrisoli]|uniref:SpoIID/LytB domain-containing protein n=1 Tax=Nocardioides terrisoli TaxID=3388267 RepID=UPI00287B92D2|nr:SpoIID/LytB domain-containing protein [Nocardioides marmorisolisilvae]
MHLPRPFRALLAAPLLLVLAAPPAGAVSVDQTFKVPASGRFTINGHGFGHGHGMSQYGAQGAALQGLGYRKIVKFYYPGTRFSTYSGNIAVLITSDTTRDVQVRVRPGLRVKDRGTGTVYRLPTRTGVKKWRLKISQRRTWVQFHNSTGWHTWRLPNGRWRLVGDGEFSSPAHLLTLVTPSGPKVLRGTLRGASAAPAGAVSDTVNVLPIDDYVQGVVAAEMPASWRPAALKAQAVAARTYALFERAANLNSWYQICDTTACQVYGGVASEYSTTNAAVRDTAGRYLSWHGQPAFTQFSASSGGWTSAGSQPYLPHQQDPYDGFSGNGVHTWSVRVSAAPLERRYPSIGTLRRVTVTQREGGGQWQGRVWAITLRGSKGSARISGTDLQSVYRLRSTWFQLGR